MAALRHIRESLAEDGTLMIVEPIAFDRAEVNHQYPLGRLFYSASTMICTPSSLAQPEAGEIGVETLVRLGDACLAAGTPAATSACT